MSVDRSRYALILMAAPSVVLDLDQAYLTYQVRFRVPNANFYINEDGKPTGNDGYWETLESDFKPFSTTHPQVLFRVDESVTYDGATTETRHYIQNGKSVTIEPEVVTTWKQFDERMLA